MQYRVPACYVQIGKTFGLPAEFLDVVQDRPHIPNGHLCEFGMAPQRVDVAMLAALIAGFGDMPLESEIIHDIESGPLDSGDRLIHFLSPDPHALPQADDLFLSPEPQALPHAEDLFLSPDPHALPQADEGETVPNRFLSAIFMTSQYGFFVQYLRQYYLV